MEIQKPTGKEYEPGEQVAKAKSKSTATSPEKIVKNIINK